MRGSVSVPFFTHTSVNTETPCFCFDFKPGEKHKLCDPRTESETFTAEVQSVENPVAALWSADLCFDIFISIEKVMHQDGEGGAVRGKGGC